MRKRAVVAIAVVAAGGLTGAVRASNQETPGVANPVQLEVNQQQLAEQQQQLAVQRQAEEQQAEDAYAKVVDLRNRTQANEDAYQARVRAALGPRAPESTMAPVPTVPPMETMSPDE